MPDANDEQQAALDQRMAKIQALMALQKQQPNPSTNAVNQIFNPVPSDQNQPSPDLSGQQPMTPDQANQYQNQQTQTGVQAPSSSPEQVKMAQAIANAVKVRKQNEQEQLKGLFSGGN